MSNLISNYEISVWEDVLIEGDYIERKICVIGADDLTYQGRVLSPQFIRRANGEKKLTFQLYKQFIDNITGEKVENKFYDYLINERKVKLFYEDKWYDFIIKNISENSATHLYTYQLEDALVQELSKNGFNKAFDVELMNNLGTIQELAEATLEGTDWIVETDTFTELVEENLVYLRASENFEAQHIYTDSFGNIAEIKEETISAGSILLAFYSCCKNMPHRFQFIFLGDEYENYNKLLVKTDENRVITVSNCQYYRDFNTLSDYNEVAEYDYNIPKCLQLVLTTSDVLDNNTDTTVSNWYKGKRFGFAQKTQYVPLLETYANIFYKSNGTGIEEEVGEPVIYYGYPNTEFNSPIFTENIIANSEFKGSSGWTGSYLGGTHNARSTFAAEIKSEYGRFVASSFQTAQSAIETGEFYTNEFQSYLRVYFPEKGMIDRKNLPFVINSGFYDNRSKIGNVNAKDQWCLDVEIYREDGMLWPVGDVYDRFDFKLQEVNYQTASGGHSLGTIWGETKLVGGRLLIEVPDSITQLTSKEFQKKQIKLIIAPTEDCPSCTIYIKKISLYKRTEDKDGNIYEPGINNLKGVVNTIYSFVKKKQIEESSSKEELSLINVKKDELDYSVYIPVYNDGAEKVRTISTKESNYFNILQSLSETFEAWLEILVQRDDIDNPGRITGKKVAFRQYLGSDNYAAFRYGINLKDIQRTFESKQLVSKLIVKQNSNELGKNGFCTIARAGSNPTGENSIYDFRYFYNMGLLDVADYVAQVYYEKNPYTLVEAEGSDTKRGGYQFNAQNYFNRLKKLNTEIYDQSDKLSGVQIEFTKLEADKVVQEGLKIAAEEGIADTRDRFYAMTGFYPDEIGTNPFSSITIKKKEGTSQNDYGDLNALNLSWDDNIFITPKITPKQSGGANGSTWEFTIDLQEDFPVDETLPTTIDKDGTDITKAFIPYDVQNIEATKSENKITLDCKASKYCGLGVSPTAGYQQNYRYRMEYTLKVIGGTLYTIGTHSASFNQTRISVDGGVSFQSSNCYTLPQGLTSSNSSIKVVIEGTFQDLTASQDSTPYLFLQPNRDNTTAVKCEITDLTVKRKKGRVKAKTGTFYLQPTFEMMRAGQVASSQTIKISCEIPPYQTKGTGKAVLGLVDVSSSSTSKLLTEYVEYQKQFQEATKKLDGKNGLTETAENKKKEIDEYKEQIKTLKEWKDSLNQAFYSKYSRFIQEGTWISEEYVDDEKYYNDALSVMYNSCFPQVAYTINVVSISSLPGYENFKFNLGDKTYVEDPEFFGTEDKIEVVITEQTDVLDDPSKSTVRVQNFKNQFQDLFQKITATVQQTQYSTGSYEKAVALAEADAQIKSRFVSDALSGMSGKLAVAGQTTVVQDQNGITLTDSETLDEMRLIGGAILMSVQDPETGERKWKTGLTPEGISASLVTAGTLNVGNIAIMNANEPVFRWDGFGISAFDADWTNNAISGKVNPFKFVRFDKYGIYGINQEDNKFLIDGRSWKPSSLEEIDGVATFALTWEGLKVTGSDGTVAKIGKHSFLPIGETDESKLKSRIMSITNKDNEETFSIDGSGNASFKGHIEATSGTIGALDIKAMVDSVNSPNANLLRNTKDKITNDKYNIATYPLTIVPKAGENYTISFKASPSTDVTQIGIYNSNGNNHLTTIYPSSGDNGYYKGTFTWKNTKDGTPGTSVVIFMMPSGSGESSIELVKLERGSIATDWVAATEDLIENETTTIKNQVNTLDTDLKEKLDAVGTGNYSWTFSDSQGIIMKSGDNEVFKVGNIDGVSGLKMEGIINAIGGNFGSLVIDGKQITSTTEYETDYFQYFTLSDSGFSQGKYWYSYDPEQPTYKQEVRTMSVYGGELRLYNYEDEEARICIYSQLRPAPKYYIVYIDPVDLIVKARLRDEI